MNNDDTTKQDILEAINTFATHVEHEFQGLKQDIGGMKQEITGIKQEITGIKQEIGQIKSQMVTKEYLDDKLANLKGDLVVLIRKEDRKLLTLVDILQQRNLITNEDVKRISALEPFPQLSV